jgi:hypothetical protein
MISRLLADTLTVPALGIRFRESEIEISQLPIRYACRSFLRTPGIAITGILAIALGVGASTSVFSVVDRLFFRALPYAEEDRVVSVGLTAPIDPNEFVLGADYLDWRAAETPFESMGTHVPGGFDCDLTDQNPVRVSCASVEATFFPTLGVQPVLGRNFRAEEDRPNQPRVVLLSYGLWYSRFAGDTSALGRAISLDGAPATVVGVLPANFEMPGMSKSDIFQLRDACEMMIVMLSDEKGEVNQAHGLAETLVFGGPLDHRAIHRIKCPDQLSRALRKDFRIFSSGASLCFRSHVKRLVKSASVSSVLPDCRSRTRAIHRASRSNR